MTGREASCDLLSGMDLSIDTRWRITAHLPSHIIDAAIIRVFLSSTFRDMQLERDHFFQHAAVRLKDVAKQRGVELVFIDLRWGLTKYDSSSGMVIIRCFESLENCPYFLCSLGSRYGWIPNKSSPVEWHPDTSVKYPFLDDIPGLSVTEYEIQYATLIEKRVASRAFFFFRDEEYAVRNVARDENESILFQAEDESSAKRQNLLKRVIESRYPAQIYQGPKHFSDMAEDALRMAIMFDFSIPQGMDGEDLAHLQFMKHRLIGFEGRHELLSDIESHINYQLENEETPIAVLAAKSGIGKSSIVAALIHRLKEKNMNQKAHISFHFVGCSNTSSYVESISCRFWRSAIGELQTLNSQSAQERQAEFAGRKGLESLMHHLAQSAQQDCHIFLIDAINQLLDSEDFPQAHMLHWLPKATPKNVALVVTTIDTHSTFQRFSTTECSIFRVGELSDAEVHESVCSYLRRYDKKLTESQVATIAQRSFQTGHPLFLRILLEELRVFGYFEKLDQEIQTLLSAPGVVQLYSMILSRWEQKYGVRLVSIASSVLSFSRVGLSENGLDDYMRHRLGVDFDLADWKSFLFTLMDSLYVRNGRYAFFHQLLKEAVDTRYLTVESLVSETREYALWVQSFIDWDSTAPDVIADVANSLLVCKEYNRLYDVLSRQQVICAMLTSRFKFEFYQSWRELEKNGFAAKKAYSLLIQRHEPAGNVLLEYFRELQENSYLQEALEQRIISDSEHEDLHIDYCYMGHVCNQTGRYDEAIPHFERALKLRHQLFGDNCASVAECHRFTGDSHYWMGRYEKALLFYQKDQSITTSVLDDHPDTATANNNVGWAYFSLKRHDEAIVSFRRGLDIQLRTVGDTHPDTAYSYNSLGAAYGAMKRNDEALQYYKKSLAIRLKIFGEIHAETATLYNNMGWLHNAMENFADALHFFQSSLRIRIQLLGESHPDVATCYNNIGLVYSSLGRSENAIESYEKAVVIRISTLGVDHPNTRKTQKNIMALLEKQDRPEPLIRFLESVIKSRESIANVDKIELAYLYRQLACANEIISEYQSALRFHRQALKLLSSRLPDTKQKIQEAEESIRHCLDKTCFQESK